MGDVRSSGYETTNDAFAQFMNAGPQMDDRNGLEVDKEYVTAMKRVGLQGVQQVMDNTMRLVEQKASTQSKSKVYLNKAFQAFDAGGGQIALKNFRKAMESFGLQFTEDQAAALFGCFDAKRSGFIHYPSLVDKIIAGHKMSAKKFAAMQAWGDRERMWDKLEKNFDKRLGDPAPRPAQKPRSLLAQADELLRAGPPQRPPQQPHWDGGNNEEQQKVQFVFERFMSHSALAKGYVPKAKEVLSWLHEAGIEATTQHARRIVVALDPCDRDGEFMSWEEFWGWWQDTFSADAEPAEERGYMQQQPHRIDHYDQPLGAQGRLHLELPQGGAGVRHNPDQLSRRSARPGSASARNLVQALRTKRGRNPGYVPYNQRAKQGGQTKSYADTYALNAPGGYQQGGQQGVYKPTRGHFQQGNKFQGGNLSGYVGNFKSGFRL